MSRSVKKVPIHGNSMAKSEKKDKMRCHRIFRSVVRERIANHEYDRCPVHYNEAMSTCVMSKDGKRYFRKALTFEYRYLMRK